MKQTFEDITIDQIVDLAAQKKEAGARAVQIHCTNTEEGVLVTYTFCHDGVDDVYENYQVQGVTPDTPLPSLQGMYLGLFPFENEAVDLFGLRVEGMVLDFAGRFYDLVEKAPMTVITPAQKAAREKAARLAKAKEARAARETASKEGE